MDYIIVLFGFVMIVLVFFPWRKVGQRGKEGVDMSAEVAQKLWLRVKLKYRLGFQSKMVSGIQTHRQSCLCVF